MSPSPLNAVAVVAALLAAPLAHAGGDGPWVEWRAYPSGQIAGLGWQAELPHVGPQVRGSVVLLANRARRGHAGRHDDERGDGWGVGLAVERFLAAPDAGWSLGARIDAFQLEIDYRDPGVVGHSRATVLQPTLSAGYTQVLDNGWHLQYSAGFGAEINVRTRGAKVGDGAIGLLGLRLGWR